MKMKKMSKWALAAMTASTVALTGCGNNDTSSSASGDSEDGQVTIRVAWWGGQERHDRTIEAIDLFEDKNPNITVEAEFTDWDGYWQRLNTQAAGNDLPDVIQMDVTRLNEYDTNDLIIDLAPFIEDGRINLGDVDDIYQESLMDGDRTLAVSLGANAFALIYNTDLAGEHDLSFDPGYTYEEFQSMMESLRGELGDNFRGFDFATAEYELFNFFIRQNGQSMYNDESTELGFEEGTLVDFFTMVQDWVNDGVAVPRDVESSFNTFGELITNEVAIGGIAASNQIIGRSTETEAELGLALLPTLAGGEGGNMIRSSMSLSITTSSDQQDAAAKFVDFMTNSVEANEILAAERGVPISSVVRDALIDQVSPEVRKTFEFLDVIAEHSSPADALPPSGETEIRSTFQRISEGVQHNTVTPEEAAQQFMREAQGIIN